MESNGKELYMRATSRPRWLAMGLAIGLLGLPVAGAPALGADRDARTPANVRVPRAIEKPAARLVDSGTFQTPIGTARWVQLSGTTRNLPRRMKALPAPGGYVVLSRPSRERQDRRAADLWFSPDMLRWTRLPSPAIDPDGNASLTASADSFWLAANEPDGARLWRSPDAREWTSIETAGVAPRWPLELGWKAVLGKPAESDGVVALPLRFQLARPGALLGLSDSFADHIRLAANASGGYDVFDGWGMFVVNLRFEETPSGLRVIEPVSGEELAVIDGVGSEFIEWWVGTSGVDLHVATVDDGALRSTPLPVPSQAATMRNLSLFGADGTGFRAHVHAVQESPMIYEDLGPWEWTSSDGAEWSEPAPFGSRDEMLPRADRVSSGPDWLQVASTKEQPKGQWRSSDGSEWEPIGFPREKAKGELALSDGWLLLGLKKSKEQAAYRPFGAKRSRSFDLGPIDRLHRYHRIGRLGDGGFFLSRQQGNDVDHVLVTIDGAGK